MVTTDHVDSLIFSSGTTFVSSEKKGAIREAVWGRMQLALVDFLMYMKQLGELDLFESGYKAKEYYGFR
jgi:hypothetical protein